MRKMLFAAALFAPAMFATPSAALVSQPNRQLVQETSSAGLIEVKGGRGRGGGGWGRGGRGKHYGWSRGRGHHKGWYRGRHGGWF